MGAVLPWTLATTGAGQRQEATLAPDVDLAAGADRRSPTIAPPDAPGGAWRGVTSRPSVLPVQMSSGRRSGYGPFVGSSPAPTGSWGYLSPVGSLTPAGTHRCRTSARNFRQVEPLVIPAPTPHFLVMCRRFSCNNSRAAAQKENRRHSRGSLPSTRSRWLETTLRPGTLRPLPASKRSEDTGNRR